MANSQTLMELQLPTLPIIGMSRFKQISPFLPISRESFRKLVRQGRAPQPHYLGSRCAMYSNVEIHKFLADPSNYIAEISK